MITGYFKNLSAQKRQASKDDMYRSFLRFEAKIGGQLFGEIPKGHRREFFCLDERTWVWHEEWLEEGQLKTRTTRYDVRPDGVLKAQDGQVYQKVSLSEIRNLHLAALQYKKRINSEIYNFL